MKRGLIAWDRAELPEAALAARLERLRGVAAAASVSALVVYTDVWRSNHVRHLSNFMPFWGRSLLVVPATGAPFLVCGHSPRVYPWLRSVTTVQDIRPAGDLGPAATRVVAESGWSRLGVLELPRLPVDVARALEKTGVELVPVSVADSTHWIDVTELAMRRKAVVTARRIVGELLESCELPGTELALSARLERSLRVEGMEDVVLWVGDGRSLPRPPADRPLPPAFCITVAAEYRGHWVMLSRTRDPGASSRSDPERLSRALADVAAASLHLPVFVHDLGGADSFRARPAASPLAAGAVVAVHVGRPAGVPLLHGETCLATGPAGAVAL
jgi:hypothetical protein